MIEWGVRYSDGVTMKRFSRKAAEESVALMPERRTLMTRSAGGPWAEAHEAGRVDQ